MKQKKVKFGLALAINTFFYIVLTLIIHKYHARTRQFDHQFNIDNAIAMSKDYLELQRLNLREQITRIQKLKKIEPQALNASGILFLAKTEGPSLIVQYQEITPPFQTVLINRDQVRLFFRQDNQFYFLYSLRLEENGPLFITVVRDQESFWQQWARSTKADITIIEEFGKGEKQILFSTLNKESQKEFIEKYFFENDFFPQRFKMNYGIYHSPSIKLFSHDTLKQNLVLSFKVTDYMLVDSLPILLLMLFAFCTSSFMLIFLYNKK